MSTILTVSSVNTYVAFKLKNDPKLKGVAVKGEISDISANYSSGHIYFTLTDGKKKLYEGEVPVTQFGIIEYLAPVLFNKNSTIKVYFDPNTGGLLKVDREEGK